MVVLKMVEQILKDYESGTTFYVTQCSLRKVGIAHLSIASSFLADTSQESLSNVVEETRPHPG